MILKTVSPVQKHICSQAQTGCSIPNSDMHSQAFDESLENPLYFCPFTLKIFFLSDICYACDNNERDFGTKNMCS